MNDWMIIQVKGRYISVCWKRTMSKFFVIVCWAQMCSNMFIYIQKHINYTFIYIPIIPVFQCISEFLFVSLLI